MSGNPELQEIIGTWLNSTIRWQGGHLREIKIIHNLGYFPRYILPRGSGPREITLLVKMHCHVSGKHYRDALRGCQDRQRTEQHFVPLLFFFFILFHLVVEHLSCSSLPPGNKAVCSIAPGECQHPCGCPREDLGTP